MAASDNRRAFPDDLAMEILNQVVNESALRKALRLCCRIHIKAQGMVDHESSRQTLAPQRLSLWFSLVYHLTDTSSWLF
ncbi:uncharacterized protein LOC132628015 isoform X2 [Lycium barbarum]|uniref:uncharacterized protein LOC132628015 isoform X2 n=1 Tax=Lycium barbarum TaxID=112863 RepID=UPI00293F213F|nr:uncharacterized protein LOC132628015 isoform X2 [Lycium barbarum]